MGYWNIVEPVWDAIKIYDGPEVFAQTFASAPRTSGLLFAAHFCQSEVCNGGFGQFFANSTGVLAPEAVEGFRVIGQVEVAALIERAIRLFWERVSTGPKRKGNMPLTGIEKFLGRT